jgi:hypothetical protein
MSSKICLSGQTSLQLQEDKMATLISESPDGSWPKPDTISTITSQNREKFES